MYTHKHTFNHSTHIRTHTYRPTRQNNTQTYAYMCIHTHIPSHTKPTHMHMHTCAHTHMYIHKQSSNQYTHTHMQATNTYITHNAEKSPIVSYNVILTIHKLNQFLLTQPSQRQACIYKHMAPALQMHTYH